MNMKSHAAPLSTSARHVLWLALGVGSLLGAIAILATQATHQKKQPIVQHQTTEAPVLPAHITAKKIATTSAIGNFIREVPQIALEQRAVSSGNATNHEPEFRGSRFIEENKGKWTLQIMQVRDEDIIRTYLGKREDRKDFSYLRLNDGKNPERYVLIYGVFDQAKAATQRAQQVQFDLPASVRIVPQQISSYRSSVNDMGDDEINSATKLRTVTLRKVAIPPPPSKVVQLSNLPPDQLEQLGGSSTVVRPRSSTSQSKPAQPRPSSGDLSAVASEQTPARQRPQENPSPESVAPPVHSTPAEPATPSEPARSPDNQVVDPF